MYNIITLKNLVYYRIYNIYDNKSFESGKMIEIQYRDIDTGLLRRAEMLYSDCSLSCVSGEDYGTYTNDILLVNAPF